MRLFVLLLLLAANAGYFAWTAGWLRDWGLAPAARTEPQRLAQQIRPEALRIIGTGNTAGNGPAVTTPADTAPPPPTPPTLIMTATTTTTAITTTTTAVRTAPASTPLQGTAAATVAAAARAAVLTASVPASGVSGVARPANEASQPP